MDIEKTRHHLSEIRNISKSDTDHFRLDRNDASKYFDGHPKFREAISSYFQKLRDDGQEIVHLDICGRASGIPLGADRSFSFALASNSMKEAFVDSRQYFFYGDLFDSKAFSKFISYTRQKTDAQPALITFTPVAGLQDHYPGNSGISSQDTRSKIVYGLLEKRLKTSINIIRPGGLIYMTRPFELMDLSDAVLGKRGEECNISIHIKDITKELKCGVKIESSIYGPNFLIRKHLPRGRKIKTN